MHEREARLVADDVIAPDFRDVNLVVLAEPPRHVDHAGGHVEVKRRANSAVMRPLRQRLEVVDRLAGLDLDDDLQLVAAVLRQQHEVGIERGRAGADRHVLLDAGVHPGLVLPAELAVQQADDAVVLELLADRPHQNRTQRTPPNGWISTIKRRILA